MTTTSMEKFVDVYKQLEDVGDLLIRMPELYALSTEALADHWSERVLAGGLKRAETRAVAKLLGRSMRAVRETAVVVGGKRLGYDLKGLLSAITKLDAKQTKLTCAAFEKNLSKVKPSQRLHSSTSVLRAYSEELKSHIDFDKRRITTRMDEENMAEKDVFVERLMDSLKEKDAIIENLLRQLYEGVDLSEGSQQANRVALLDNHEDPLAATAQKNRKRRLLVASQSVSVAKKSRLHSSRATATEQFDCDEDFRQKYLDATRVQRPVSSQSSQPHEGLSGFDKILSTGQQPRRDAQPRRRPSDKISEMMDVRLSARQAPPTSDFQYQRMDMDIGLNLNEDALQRVDEERGGSMSSIVPVAASIEVASIYALRRREAAQSRYLAARDAYLLGFTDIEPQPPREVPAPVRPPYQAPQPTGPPSAIQPSASALSVSLLRQSQPTSHRQHYAQMMPSFPTFPQKSRPQQGQQPTVAGPQQPVKLPGQHPSHHPASSVASLNSLPEAPTQATNTGPSLMSGPPTSQLKESEDVFSGTGALPVKYVPSGIDEAPVNNNDPKPKASTSFNLDADPVTTSPSRQAPVAESRSSPSTGSYKSALETLSSGSSEYFSSQDILEDGAGASGDKETVTVPTVESERKSPGKVNDGPSVEQPQPQPSHSAVQVQVAGDSEEQPGSEEVETAQPQEPQPLSYFQRMSRRVTSLFSRRADPVEENQCDSSNTTSLARRK